MLAKRTTIKKKSKELWILPNIMKRIKLKSKEPNSYNRITTIIRLTQPSKPKEKKPHRAY